jgi:small subunit ribosomal protein S13
MRILGINIPDKKRIEIALTYIYGIGRSRAAEILNATKIENKRASELTPEEVNKIKTYIENNFTIEGELRQLIRRNISQLISLKNYRGIRHAKHLPVRGQRTRTNSRTVRGNKRKTMGSGRRKIELK